MERLSFKHLAFFFFCTLVHRSALDFEPGTKRHNIWYPVQELLEMLPYGWAIPSQFHIRGGRLGRGGGMAEKKDKPVFFLLKWKSKWEFKVLSFILQIPRSNKNLPWCFWKQHIQNASKTFQLQNQKGSKLTNIPSLLLKDSKPRIQGALFPYKRGNN